jgi:hypothetical protein
MRYWADRRVGNGPPTIAELAIGHAPPNRFDSTSGGRYYRGMLRTVPAGFVEPCLPSPAERPPSGPDWVHEIKHDGFRMMVRRDAAGVRLLTRNGHDWSDRYPLIAARSTGP